MKFFGALALWLAIIASTTIPVSALEPEVLTEEDMVGWIELPPRSTTLIGLGDNVIVNIDPTIVMVGDRMNVFEIIKSQTGVEGINRIVTPVGRIVITDIRGEMVVAKVEFAKREIFVDSYVRFRLPEALQKTRYYNFLRGIVNSRLKDPLNEEKRIKAVVLDVTDEWGNINRLGETIYGELTEAVCERPQFNCLDRDEISAFLASHGIRTSKSIGRFMRQKLSAKFGLEQLITATAVQDGEQVKIILSSYDVEREYKTPEIELTALRSEYLVMGGPAEEIVLETERTGHGFWKVSVTEDGFTDGRRVDYLFAVNLDDYVFKKHRDSLSENLSEDVELGNVQVKINGKTVSSSGKSVLYSDLVESKSHTVTISATPLLKGEGNLIIGRTIEKKVNIEIPFDSSVQTEIILKTWGRQAFIVIDTKPLIENVAFKKDSF